MRLEFDGVTDFIGKRVNLFQEFWDVRNRIESGLMGVNTFSEAELSDIPNTDLTRYFMLKELLEHNQSFVYGVPDSHHRGEVKVVGGDVIKLDVRAYRPDENRILEFLSEAYRFFPGEKQAWLIGEKRENEGWVSDDPERRHDNPFNTRKIVEDAGLTDSLVLFGSDQAGPRDGYDKTAYQRFRSPEGFGPVVEFCSRFPHQFFQAIIKTPEGELYLEPQRKRHAGWAVTHYSGRVDLKSSTGDELIELGKMVDEHLVAA